MINIEVPSQRLLRPSDLVGFGRIWSDLARLVGFGRIRSDLAGFGWSSPWEGTYIGGSISTSLFFIHKFIVKDSVEDRMLILQQKKRELMKKAFGNRKQNAQERRRAALQDLGTLLGLNLMRPRVV